MGGGTALNANLMGGQAVRQLGGLLGVEDPMMQRESAKRQLATGLDMSKPEQVMEYAKRLTEAGLQQEAAQAMLGARAMQEQTQRIATSRANEQRALREPGQVNFQQLLSSGKYTPASIAKFKDSENPADLVLVKGAAGDGAMEGAGPVGKSGAWRDADGIVYSASEMKKQREGFQGAEKLLENLNSIKEADVKNAESWIDWTQGENRKQVCGKVAATTIAAQAKINASQLLKQIESLPPGSASNADMVAAKSSFPGYGDSTILQQWINDTKTLLQNSLTRQSEQYGFKQRVGVSPVVKEGNNNDPLGLRTEGKK
jgi:hypothetical protein